MARAVPRGASMSRYLQLTNMSDDDTDHGGLVYLRFRVIISHTDVLAVPNIKQILGT